MRHISRSLSLLRTNSIRLIDGSTYRACGSQQAMADDAPDQRDPNGTALDQVLVRKKAGTPYTVYVPQGPRQDILCKAVTVRRIRVVRKPRLIASAASSSEVSPSRGASKMPHSRL